MLVDQSSERLSSLQAEAEAAEARYDHATAVARYTEALALPGLRPRQRYALLDGRATAYYRWGHLRPYARAVNELVKLAREIGDRTLLAEAVLVHGFHLSYDGQERPSRDVVDEALRLAEQMQDARLLCFGHLLLTTIFYEEEQQVDQSWAMLHKGLEFARRSADDDALFAAVEFQTGAHGIFRQNMEAQALAAEARALAAATGDLYKIARAAAKSGIAANDLAVQRRYYESAYATASSANDEYGMADTANLLALLFWKLGLYDSSVAYAMEATERARGLQLAYHVSNDLDCLGRAYLGKGMIAEARRAFREGLDQQEVGWVSTLFHKLGLILADLAEGAEAEAIDPLQMLLDQYAFDPMEPTIRAVLSSAYLAEDDSASALKQSDHAVALLETRPTVGEFHTQEIWWRHYQVLLVVDPQRSYAVLDKAKETMLEAIASLSDEGLRRNYLNKVAVNRMITLAWVEEAARLGHAVEIFTAHEPIAGNLREQFRRVVDIGARLTAQHDPETLADFIVREFVEMSGAERVVLLGLEGGRSRVRAAFNAHGAEEIAAAMLEAAAHSRRPLLRQDVGQAPQGSVAELYQRSLIALPLIAQNQLLGLLYGDMRQVFGRFDESDLNLLSMLANQAAAALDNADLVRGLEEKVKERTADLEARNNELAIVNSVQEGLVAELDLQAIFDLVGDHIVAISGAQAVAIYTYDYDAGAVRPRFDVEDGRRVDSPVRIIDPNREDFAADRGPVYFRTLEEFIDHFGPEVLEKVPDGTAIMESVLYIPLLVGETMMGYIDLQDERPHAFSDSDIDLFMTLARSMSVALENARLFQDAQEARAEAEAANESKSRFLASMSHELRTPLNAIIGFTRIVQRKTTGMIPEKQRDNLEKVKGSAEHLLGLINTILDLAKIEAGRVEIVTSPIDAAALVNNCAEITRPLLRSAVVIRTAVEAGLPEFVSDEDKLRQILLNLLSNAAKFTHEGEIVVEVSKPRPDSPLATRDSDSQLIIEVRDTGIGMTEEQLGRVFEEFQQAEETTSRQYGGTGLGLPISKQLARLLGGDLTAESSPDEGSVFRLLLPVAVVS